MKRSAEEISKLVQEQKASGQSVLAFCTARGLRDTTFYTWRARVQEDDSKFARVGTERRIELDLSNGVTLRVAAEDLKSVLEALR